MEGEEGKAMRERMKSLKDSAANALKDGGSSMRLYLTWLVNGKILGGPRKRNIVITCQTTKIIILSILLFAFLPLHQFCLFGILLNNLFFNTNMIRYFKMNDSGCFEVVCVLKKYCEIIITF